MSQALAYPPYVEDKLAELILYVSARLAGDPSFGATKLNKVLFFTDFISYRENRVAVTGAVYQKLDYGPAPRRLLPVQQRLVADGDAEVEERTYLGYRQRRLIPLRDADESLFSSAELRLVDEVIDALKGVSAVSVSDVSHRLSVGWQIAAKGDDIPYQTSYLSSEPLTDDDQRRGREVADELGFAP
jgi:hypothetical protein